MTNIWILSDLHGDHGVGYQPPVVAPDCDVIVVAGDAFGRLSTRALYYVADALRDADRPIVYVPGNHDFWQANVDLEVGKARDVADRLGIHLLADGEALVLAGTRFIGATLWTDYDVFGMTALSQQVALRGMLDFRLMRRGLDYGHVAPEDLRDIHFVHRARIEAHLAVPFDGSTVVVTHHAPHPRSLRAGRATEPMDAAFASDLSALILDPGAPALWVHGHVHESRDYVVGGTRVVCNPHGYRSRMHVENQCFDPCLVVRV